MFSEGKTLEFKRQYVDDIKNTVTAFANCDGGTLYIGIDDDGSVCGVDNADDIMLRVTSAVRDAVRPDITMFTECRSEIMDDKTVICVSVQRGTARPYYIHGKGIRPEGVYVRQGASTVPATEAAILAMIKETAGDSYENARSFNQELTFNQTQKFFEERGIKFGETQMRTLHFIGEDNTYTNLAFLLSEQCTHTIKAAVFEGSTKTVFKNRKEFSGSLLVQLEDAFSYINQYNRTRSEFPGLYRVDARDYPIEAIREALINAIVHRDYSFSASILIRMFDDRIEIVTVGGLLKGISVDDVKLGVSALRNQNLANVFYRLKLIEAYGTGILKINESYNGYTVKPIIEVSDNAFKITLPNTNFPKERQTSLFVGETAPAYNIRTVRTKADERKSAVIEMCREKGYVVRRDLERSLGVSQATAILILRDMTESGILVKEGAARQVRYYLNSSAVNSIKRL